MAEPESTRWEAVGRPGADERGHQGDGEVGSADLQAGT